MRQDAQLTWFERNLAERMKDPEFAEAYQQTKAEIAEACAAARRERRPPTLALTWMHMPGPTAESVVEQLKALEPGWLVSDEDGLVIRRCAEVDGWMAEAYRPVRPGEAPVSYEASFQAALSTLH